MAAFDDTSSATRTQLEAVQSVATGAGWPERFANYTKVMKLHPHLYINPVDGWVEGYWSLGHYERHADYHGAYPKNLLKRYAALFFDRGTVIHVCSGMLKPDNKWLPGDTLDINSAREPTYCVNAESCEGVPLHRYDTAFVDGPYGDADAEIYGCPMLVRQRVLGALIHGMRPGARIVWLDEKNPTYPNSWPIKWEAVWGVCTSNGHRTRTVFVYRRTA